MKTVKFYFVTLLCRVLYTHAVRAEHQQIVTHYSKRNPWIELLQVPSNWLLANLPHKGKTQYTYERDVTTDGLFIRKSLTT